jgi:hypothetical protein
MRRVKVKAASEGVTLREVVLGLLEQVAAQEKRKDVKADLQVTVPEQPVAKVSAPASQQPAKVAPPLEREEEQRSGCPECGSLSGHQKFCSKR